MNNCDNVNYNFKKLIEQKCNSTNIVTKQHVLFLTIKNAKKVNLDIAFFLNYKRKMPASNETLIYEYSISGFTEYGYLVYKAMLQQEIDDNENILILLDNYVSDMNSKNKGIGSAGMDCIKEFAYKLGVSKIVGIKNPIPNNADGYKNLTAFYSKNGFIKYKGRILLPL